MRNEFVNDAALRRFLLGDVEDDERQRIERLFIIDPEVNQRILAAEDDLFEDYLENSLSAPDRDKFLLQYGHTPPQRRRIRIVRSIKDYAVAEARTQAAHPNHTRRRTFLSMLGLRNRMFLVPVAATLVIALIVAVFWLVRWNTTRDQENNLHLAIERELSDLNNPSRLQSVPPQLLSMVLPPVSLRSPQARPELSPQPDVRVIELRLLWTQKERYASYRAEVHLVGKPDRYTVSNLHIENTGSGSAVRVRLPASRLIAGLYQVTLSGIASNGKPDLSEEYAFSVAR